MDVSQKPNHVNPYFVYVFVYFLILGLLRSYCLFLGDLSIVIIFSQSILRWEYNPKALFYNIKDIEAWDSNNLMRMVGIWKICDCGYRGLLYLPKSSFYFKYRCFLLEQRRFYY